jgi:ABC-type transport system involved in multi-copper enzyme maturation permease subunit
VRHTGGRYGAATAGWELTRLARRGTPLLLRAIVGVLLLTSLIVIYYIQFPRDLDLLRDSPAMIDRILTQFGRQFCFILLIVQACVVLLVAPLTVAGSIIEEVERKTLEFLLATDLSPREIILGKLWPRLLQVASVVLLGIPILAITLVWGGVDFLFVALAELCILASIWSISGISACMSVGAKSFRQAVVRSYLVSLVLQSVPLVSCPILAIVYCDEVVTKYRTRTVIEIEELFQWAVPFALYFLVQLTLGCLMLGRAFHKLKHAQSYYTRSKVRVKPPAHWERHPPVPDESPLLWKELYLSGQTGRFVRLMALVPWPIWLCVSAVGSLIMLVMFIDNDIVSAANAMMRYIGGFFIVMMCLTAGLNAAGSVSRERQQETLIDLLMIPEARRRILRAKWLGSLAKTRGLIVGFLSIPVVALLSEGIDWPAIPLLVIAAYVFISLSISFGLWLSVRLNSVRQASNIWLLASALFVGSTLIVNIAMDDELDRTVRRPRIGAMGQVYFPEPEPGTEILNGVAEAVSPTQIWWRLAFRTDEIYAYDRSMRRMIVHNAAQLIPTALGLLVLYLTSRVFYALAERRFRTRNE